MLLNEKHPVIEHNHTERTAILIYTGKDSDAKYHVEPLILEMVQMYHGQLQENSIHIDRTFVFKGAVQ